MDVSSQRINSICRTILSIFVTALFLTGCAAQVTNITMPASETSIEASRDMATIVVVQPSTHYRNLSVLDGNGNLLGQLHDRSYTVMQVPAGPLRLYVLAERKATWGDRIQGEVLAGRIYYATISLRYGGIRFNSLNSRSPDSRWGQRDLYLTRGHRLQMDPQRIVTAVEELGETAEILDVIDDYSDRYNLEQIEVHTIRPEDGVRIGN